MSDNTKMNYGLKAFIPLFVFLTFYLGSGILFTILGKEAPFSLIPRDAALIFGLTTGLIMCKGSFDYRMDLFSKAAGDPGNILMCVIFLVAGAFAGVAKAMGGVESTVNLGLTFIPLQFIVAGVFIISSFVATAMGTSMGTIAAIGPIAVEVAEKGGISPELSIAAVLCGSMFGDNLSIISDTTIAATRGVGCKMNEKFKMNLKIAVPAAIATIIVYSVLGSSGTLDKTFEYDIIKVLPYIAVIIAAIMGFNVIIVLLGGIAVSGIVGFLTGSLNFITFCQAIKNGMSGMFGIVIIALLMKGIIGLVTQMGGLDWLISKLTANIKTRKGAEYGIGFMVALADAALSNNTIAIILTAPLVKNIAKKYNIAPRRVASLLDIFSCIMQGFIPHSGQILLCVSLLGGIVSPFLIMSNSFYLMFLLLASVITIQFGLLRTKEEKEGIQIYEEDK